MLDRIIPVRRRGELQDEEPCRMRILCMIMSPGNTSIASAPAVRNPDI